MNFTLQGSSKIQRERDEVKYLGYGLPHRHGERRDDQRLHEHIDRFYVSFLQRRAYLRFELNSTLRKKGKKKTKEKQKKSILGRRDCLVRSQPEGDLLFELDAGQLLQPLEQQPCEEEVRMFLIFDENDPQMDLRFLER
jgi:hypothetical protein